MRRLGTGALREQVVKEQRRHTGKGIKGQDSCPGLQLTPRGATGIWVGGRGLHPLPSSQSSPQRPQLRTQLSPPSDSGLAAVLPYARGGSRAQHRKGCGRGWEGRGAARDLGVEGDIQVEKPWHLPAGSACAASAMWLWAAVGVCPPPSARSTAGHLFLISKWHYVITAGWMCILSYLLEPWVDSGGDLQAGPGWGLRDPGRGFLATHWAEPSEASGSHGPCWSPGAALQRHKEKRSK